MTVVDAIVAAAAALLGSLITFVGTYWLARVERRRREFRDAVNAVLRAFVEFRHQQYLKIEDRKRGVEDTRETRDARYTARDALTVAIDQLATSGCGGHLLDAAEEARRMAIALGDTAPAAGQVDGIAVDRIGGQCREAHTALRYAARHALNR